MGCPYLNPGYGDILLKEQAVAVEAALPDFLESWDHHSVSINRTTTKAAVDQRGNNPKTKPCNQNWAIGCQ